MLDQEQRDSLRKVAGVLAQWLKDNPDSSQDEKNDKGMRVLAKAFIQLYFEAIEAGIVKIEPNKDTVH